MITKELAERYVESAYKTFIDGIVDAILKDADGIPGAALAYLRTEMVQVAREAFIKTAMDFLDENEAEAVIRFHDSPEGRSIRLKVPRIAEATTAESNRQFPSIVAMFEKMIDEASECP